MKKNKFKSMVNKSNKNVTNGKGYYDWDSFKCLSAKELADYQARELVLN